MDYVYVSGFAVGVIFNRVWHLGNHSFFASVMIVYQLWSMAYGRGLMIARGFLMFSGCAQLGIDFGILNDLETAGTTTASV